MCTYCSRSLIVCVYVCLLRVCVSVCVCVFKACTWVVYMVRAALMVAEETGQQFSQTQTVFRLLPRRWRPLTPVWMRPQLHPRSQRLHSLLERSEGVGNWNKRRRIRVKKKYIYIYYFFCVFFTYIVTQIVSRFHRWMEIFMSDQSDESHDFHLLINALVKSVQMGCFLFLSPAADEPDDRNCDSPREVRNQLSPPSLMV